MDIQFVGMSYLHCSPHIEHQHMFKLKVNTALFATLKFNTPQATLEYIIIIIEYSEYVGGWRRGMRARECEARLARRQRWPCREFKATLIA